MENDFPQVLNSMPNLAGLRVHGIDGMNQAELDKEIQAGGRFVFYEYCISAVVISMRRPTKLFFLRSNQFGLLRGLPYSLISLLFGWWGIPWGLIYTPLTLITNLSGGCDVTEQVLASLDCQLTPVLGSEDQTSSDELESASREGFHGEGIS
jgi:hypothetical protein